MTDYWMLVRQGFVQRLKCTFNGETVLAFLIFKSHTDANRYMKRAGSPEGVRPSQIGSVQGETLEGHLSLAQTEGCKVIACPQGWNEDGSPVWGYIPMEK